MKTIVLPWLFVLTALLLLGTAEQGVFSPTAERLTASADGTPMPPPEPSQPAP